MRTFVTCQTDDAEFVTKTMLSTLINKMPHVQSICKTSFTCFIDFQANKINLNFICSNTDFLIATKYLKKNQSNENFEFRFVQ